jgi:hypothetical protein
MPVSRELARGKKVRFTLEVTGPRTAVQGKRFERALRALLRKSRATIVRPAARKRSRKRKR